MKAKLPKITVLVPSYNHGQFISKRIESILNQTYRNFELIVIDDCSKDNSNEIISDLKSKYDFTFLQNEKNSGSPFTSWDKICDLAQGRYIWICESDDVAEPTFLAKAVESFSNSPDAVLFYCNSQVIDKYGETIGHTKDYFQDIWKETRWNQNFCANGNDELINFQLRGQTVPNMSSALFLKEAFQSALTPFLKQLKLTGDWLFIGEIMKYGDVIFSYETLNQFRKHEITSRERVKSARSQAEFILTKYLLFKTAKQPLLDFAPLMKTDIIRFLYESAKWYEVIKELLKISIVNTFSALFLLLISTIQNPKYIKSFISRFKHAKTLSSNGVINK